VLCFFEFCKATATKNHREPGRKPSRKKSSSVFSPFQGLVDKRSGIGHSRSAKKTTGEFATQNYLAILISDLTYLLIVTTRLGGQSRGGLLGFHAPYRWPWALQSFE